MEVPPGISLPATAQSAGRSGMALFPRPWSDVRVQMQAGLPVEDFDFFGASPITNRWTRVPMYEKARLDNFAIQLLNENPTTLGHIIVYDGQGACRGEAVAQAMRAKKYLVEYRKVPAHRIVFRKIIRRARLD